MPAEIVNLNKFRKAKERAEKERRAEENRVKHGRTKAEKVHDRDEPMRYERRLDDASLISRPDGSDPTGEHDDASEDPTPDSSA